MTGPAARVSEYCLDFQVDLELELDSESSLARRHSHGMPLEGTDCDVADGQQPSETSHRATVSTGRHGSDTT